MNPYDLTAGPFLVLYALLFVSCLGFALYERNRARPGLTPDVEGLDPVELGYLAGGVDRALDVAVVGLLQHDAASYDSRTQRVRLHDREVALPAYLRPFRDRLGPPRGVPVLARARK